MTTAIIKVVIIPSFAIIKVAITIIKVAIIP